MRENEELKSRMGLLWENFVDWLLENYFPTPLNYDPDAAANEYLAELWQTE